jgi:hypothetical protein
MKNYFYEKHFTIDEARALVPELREKLSGISKITLELKMVGFDIYTGKYKPGFHPGTRNEFPDDYTDLIGSIKSITEQGIELKALEYGLVDFPAIRQNGEEVFLCWKLDEDDIEYWHPIPAGFKGREHISNF